MVYWWVGNWGKKWYAESQIFKVGQPHPHAILAKVTPQSTTETSCLSLISNVTWLVVCQTNPVQFLITSHFTSITKQGLFIHPPTALVPQVCCHLKIRALVSAPGGSLSHLSATHPCAHTSKSAPKWRNAHHQILHP